MAGQFVISLDFELHWGTRDAIDFTQRRDEIVGGRQAVSAMLRLFESRGIHATWATVGILFASTKAEALQAAPTRRPAYDQQHLRPYSELEASGATEAEDPYHFAGSLVDAIARTPGQELATHTYSHYYCLECGQSVEDFEADLGACKAIGARFGDVLGSIVFPRNQYATSYLETARRAGVRCFRGNPSPWFWQPRAHGEETRLQRALRFSDAYAKLARTPVQSVTLDPSGLVNVPATRFLRPWSRKLASADRLRLARIKSQMRAAARQGGLFHLWWHPNNFSHNLSQNLGFLERVLDEYELLHRREGMLTQTMSEAAARVSRHADSDRADSDRV